jgi:hypothetical protein
MGGGKHVPDPTSAPGRLALDDCPALIRLYA